MKLPRWLHHNRFVSELLALDTLYQSEHRNGSAIVEVHYRNGTPLIAKVREVPAALVEFRLTIAAATT